MQSTITICEVFGKWQASDGIDATGFHSSPSAALRALPLVRPRVEAAEKALWGDRR